MTRTFTLLTLFLAMNLANAESLTLESGPSQVQLLELYTSEGCSSCPPADHWLSQLKSDPDIWKTVVPVALHVDYWDWIGWPDRFADKRFSKRQRALARKWRAGTVYTPGFVLAGQEWRSRRLPDVKPLSDAGKLTTVVENGKLNIIYQPPEAAPDELRFEAHIALLGFDLSTRVTAGENRSRTLTHDFVALDYQSKRLESSEEDASWVTLAEVPITPYQQEELGLAVWVSQAGDPTPIQAVGSMLQ